MTRDTPTVNDSDIAIVGMAGRFPGAPDVERFWSNLRGGVESIRFFSEDELRAAGVGEAALRRPNYVKAGTILDEAEMFDADFFGFNLREAEVTDPQQRVFLECVWEALENAGHDPARFDGSIGVFGGTNLSTYLLNNLLENPKVLDVMGMQQIAMANIGDFLTTRVAYKLDLKGPAVTVGCACSTSLVAVHLACQSLLAFECDMALAGCSSLKPPQQSGYLFQEGGILSPDGHCRVFDESAQGTIFGNGAGAVVLRRLADALEQGDRIEAVIRGSAINNDGAEKVGFTAPSVKGQARVITEALGVAGVPAESISYIEAHGTGTALGDPIEIEALTRAFRHETQRKGFCAIGSVKSNIGHLDAAAGMASLIKTVQALKHRELPATLNFERPNPRIDFENSPFKVNRELTGWESGASPRRAGVSAFGFGGTNAHVIVEEAPRVASSENARTCLLLPLSARTETALERVTDNLAAALSDDESLRPADAAFTLQTGRKVFAHRRVAICRDRVDAVQVLRSRDRQRCHSTHAEHAASDVAFLFPGQGSQYVGMARELFRDEPVFRRELDRCATILDPHLGYDLCKLIYPDPADEEEAGRRLTDTAAAQPAIVALSCALSRLWMHWGIRPAALVGHSVGEYAAACVAGVMSLESALRLVAVRGRLMASMPAGSMLTVARPAEAVEKLLEDDLVVAAVNTPEMCVVSGTHEAVRRFTEQRSAEGIHCRALHTSHAFHSPMMDPIVDEFRREIEGVELRPPEIPIVSTVTGRSLSAAEATDSGYWARNLRQPVRFSEALTALLATPRRALVEVGPGSALSMFASQNPACTRENAVVGSVRHPKDTVSDQEFLTTTLARLWLCGIVPDWTRYYEGQRRIRATLPTYPFEKKRCWIEPERSDRTELKGDVQSQEGSRVEDGWFSEIVWEQTDAWDAHPTAPEATRALIVSLGATGVPELTDRLERNGCSVTGVAVGDTFSVSPGGEYRIDPAVPEHYARLRQSLEQRDALPGLVLLLVPSPGSCKTGDVARQALSALLYLVRALSSGTAGDPRVLAVTAGAHAVRPSGKADPDAALLSGPCKVITQEYPTVECRQIDLEPPTSEAERAEAIDGLCREIGISAPDVVVAHRAGSRWVPRSRPLSIEAGAATGRRLREGGVYLITGGLGGIGLTLAEDLARRFRARLVLTGRTALPDRSRWDEILVTTGASDPLRTKIEGVRRLESHGAEVLICAADVARRDEMLEVRRAIDARFGELHGIVHAAGVPGSGRIEDLTAERLEAVLSPKVDGTRRLAELFGSSGLELVVLCSSVAAVVGGSGLADYSAANMFLDATARSDMFGPGTRVVAINWPAWRDVGMAAGAVEAAEELDGKPASITPEEGSEVFRRIVADPHAQVVVSPQPLNEVLAWVDSLYRPHSSYSASKGEPSPAPAAASPVPPTGLDSARMLKELWQELLGVDEVGPDDNFFVLGGNSLLAVRLFELIDDKLGLRFSVATIFQSPTIRQLEELIHKSGVLDEKQPGREAHPQREHLVAVRPEGAMSPLFLVHDIGGGILNYNALTQSLEENQPVFGLIARGFDGRHEPHTTVEEMALAYIEELLAEHPRGPYNLGGFSFGSQVAYEMARQLTAMGHVVGLLAIFDQPPANWRSLHRRWRPSRILNFLINLPHWTGDIIEQEPAELLFRLRSKFVAFGKLARARSNPESGATVTMDDLHREFSAMPEVRRTLQEAEHQATMKYFPKPFPGKLTLFRGTRQPLLGCHDTHMGWSALALGGVEVHRIGAKHSEMFVEPHVRELADTLTACLERADSSGGSQQGVTSSSGVQEPVGSGSTPIK